MIYLHHPGPVLSTETRAKSHHINPMLKTIQRLPGSCRKRAKPKEGPWHSHDRMSHYFSSLPLISLCSSHSMAPMLFWNIPDVLCSRSMYGYLHGPLPLILQRFKGHFSWKSALVLYLNLHLSSPPKFPAHLS